MARLTDLVDWISASGRARAGKPEHKQTANERGASRHVRPSVRLYLLSRCAWWTGGGLQPLALLALHRSLRFSYSMATFRSDARLRGSIVSKILPVSHLGRAVIGSSR